MIASPSAVEVHPAGNYRWRYSLRTLLTLTTIVACLLGGWRWYWGWYIRQEAAIQELTEKKLARLGSWYDRSKGWRGWILSANLAKNDYLLEVRSDDPKLFSLLGCVSLRAVSINTPNFDDQDLNRLLSVAPDIESLVLRRSNVTNEGLESVRRLKSLTHLSLGDVGMAQRTQGSRGERWYEFPANQFNGDVFQSLRDCQGLRELRVISNSLSGQQMEALSQLSQLESLVLISPQLSDECLQKIAAQQNLRDLLLGGGNFTATGVKHLTALKELRLLAFKESHVEGTALVHVAALPSLEMLSLEHTGIANGDLTALGSAPRLWNHYLAGSELDNSLLPSLKGCERLAHLHLHETAVNDDGVEMLNELKYLHEIFIRADQLSASMRKRCSKLLTILDTLKAGDPPEFFFGPGMSHLNMRLFPSPFDE